MLSVKIAKFVKRENSTKVYSGAWNEYNCALKRNCSEVNPVIEIRTTDNISGYNYMYIDYFKRYYFISDIQYNNGVIEIVGTCDVMATYKAEIGAASEYVLRAASSYNGNIRDDLYPCKIQSSFTQSVISGTGLFDSSNITYIVGVINNETSNKFGAVEYYTLTSSQIASLMSYLLGHDVAGVNIMGATDSILQTLVDVADVIAEGVARNLVNPTQYIVESYALPYSVSAAASVNIKAGWWTVPASGSPLTSSLVPVSVAGAALEIPKHPQASARGSYMNASPYTELMLYAGPFGVIPLDTLKLIGSNYINLDVKGDKFGNCFLRITEQTTGAVIDQVTANVKCNFPLGQITTNVLAGGQSALSSFVDVSAKSAAGNIYGAGVGVVNGIVNGVDSALPQVSRSGMSGNFLNCFDFCRIVATFHDVVDDDITHRGRPLCEQRTISSLSGYILVADADIATSGTDAETKKIRSYMNGGFYYE